MLPLRLLAGTPDPTVPGTVDTSSFPGWVWVLVSIVGLLAVIVVGLRFLRGR
jgi:hypothetical protein